VEPGKARKHALATADILPMADYGKIRVEARRKIAERKRNRRAEVGPYITFYFENYDTMWMQVHEMLFIEKGGPSQVAEEIAAYNPLIPQGHELVATFMIEIDEEERRKRILGSLGGIEDTAFISIGAEKIAGAPETDQDRTNAAGKASSVQFVHFPFTAAQVSAFKTPGAQVILGFSLPAYSHMTIMPEAVRAELSGDFD
jgi:hypothetical protein